MEYFRLVAAVIAAALLSACAHRTENTNQFYLAQTYLPLPDPNNAPPDPPGPWPQPPGEIEAIRGHCSAGPVAAYKLGNSGRIFTQVLPGMRLRVVQTTYAATRADAVPVLTEWTWRIPTALNCGAGDVSVPQWDQDSYLRVRHLLSGAQQLERREIDPSYFQGAVDGACGETSSFPDCMQLAFFDRFVRGMMLDTRMLADRSPPTGRDGGWDPNVPAAVRASASRGQVTDKRGMGRWYSGLSAPSWPADAFRANEQGARCATAFKDPQPEGPNPATLPQDAAVCAFALDVLGWRQPGPYDLGGLLVKVHELELLRSSDPLFLFQPKTHVTPLDLANQALCQKADNCPLRGRTTQGFVRLELSIPVYVEGRLADLVWTPVGMSIANFERARGLPSASVTAVRRSIDWLPELIAVDDAAEAIPTRRLAGGSGRVTLRFDDRGLGGVSVGDTREDLILAPGDVIVLRRP